MLLTTTSTSHQPAATIKATVDTTLTATAVCHAAAPCAAWCAPKPSDTGAADVTATALSASARGVYGGRLRQWLRVWNLSQSRPAFQCLFHVRGKRQRIRKLRQLHKALLP